MRRTILLVSIPIILMAVPAGRADDDNGGGGNQWNWLQKLGNSDQGSDDSQPTSVAGVRGLEETSGKVDTKARDYPAIDRLDKIAIADMDLKKFSADGGLK